MSSIREKCILLFLLIIIVMLPSCVQQETIDISKTAQTIISTPMPEPVNASIPVSGIDEIIETNRPVVIDILFPDIVESGSTGAVGKLHFSDTNGDIYAAQFTCIECACMDFEYFAFDPMIALQSGDRNEGTFQFQQSCKKCKESTGDIIKMQVQLFDHAGNASKPAEYDFECK